MPGQSAGNIISTAWVARFSVRILISETWRYPIYGQILLDRFKQAGVEAFAFKEGAYFKSTNPFGNLAAKAQFKYRFGTALHKLNADLTRLCSELNIDTAFFVRGDMIYPETLKHLRSRNVYIMGCNNDNPFSSENAWYLWRHLIGGLPLYNHYFAYRDSNVSDFRRYGCPGATVLRSFYINEANYPIEDLSNSPFNCDVSFTGHWEADGREHFLDPLISDKMINFKLWGTLWNRAKNHKSISERFGEIKPLYGAEYNLAINSSKIALVFLSQLNRDTYTRRCFEIPAAGTFMLAPRNPDLQSLFKEGVEAEFFATRDEMMDKIRYYISNDSARKAIAKAGRERLLGDGHEAEDRVRTVIRHVRQHRGLSSSSN